ncbi:MAG: hypothetical protein RSA27_08230 [Oscillospiraceae bacterium]
MKNDIKDAFLNIKAEEKLKDSTKSAIYKNSEKRKPFFKPIMASVCAACIIIASFGGYSINAKTSTISIDINPSVELRLNVYERIIEAVGINEDGKKVVENLNVKYNTIDEATRKILKSATEKNLLSPNADIAVSSKNENQAEEITKKCHDSLSGHHSFGNITNTVVDDETLTEANEYQISVNKLLAIKELQKYDDSVNVEQYRHIKTRDIKEEISKYTGENLSGDNNNQTNKDSENTSPNEAHTPKGRQHHGGRSAE